jgi:hypothetical protein
MKGKAKQIDEFYDILKMLSFLYWIGAVTRAAATQQLL